MDDLNEIESDDVIVELTADIVAAYVSNNVVQVSDLPGIIADVHHALRDTHGSPEPAVPERGEPAVPVKRSVKDDEIICLECGLKLKSLKRHLMASHGLSPGQYREKWQLASDYPTVAPQYAEARSRLAKNMGLGRKLPTQPK